MQGMVSWNRPMLERMKKRYSKAVERGEEVFRFDGHEYVRDYAKYLIEYLESVLPD